MLNHATAVLLIDTYDKAGVRLNEAIKTTAPTKAVLQEYTRAYKALLAALTGEEEDSEC